MAEKDVDLMEQILKQTDDEKGYFKTMKEIVINTILSKPVYVNWELAEVRRLIIKYNNNHCFEILNKCEQYAYPLISQHPNAPYSFGLREMNYFNASEILQKNKNNFTKFLCYYTFFWYLNFNFQINTEFDEYHFNDRPFYIVKELLKDFYNIEEDKNAEYGYRVFPKHNIELSEATEKLAENEPSLRKVLDFMYACDYVNALKELALLLEPKRKEYKEKIQKGNETLFDIDKFFNFVNNYGIRHNNKKQKQAKEEQLKVHLDFGLSIYRLFTIYGDL